MSTIDARQPASQDEKPQTVGASTGYSSWDPTPLDSILAGEHRISVPRLGLREDGAALLYPGKSHSVTSEPEAGKTWLALLFAAQEMERGNHVFFLDYEDDAAGIVNRLLALGVAHDIIGSLFVYLQPLEPLSSPNGERFLGHVRELRPTLVVLDGVTEAMTIEGLSLLDNQDVARFARRLTNPVAAMGPAVMLLDHEVKSARAQGRYSLGAQHKLAAISGAAFKLKSVSTFAVGQTGRSILTVSKDRHGGVRRISRGQSSNEYLAELVVEGISSEAVNVRLVENPGASLDLSPRQRIRKNLLHVIGSAEKPFTRKTEIYDQVPGKQQWKVEALQELEAEGKISKDGEGFKVTALSSNASVE